MFAGVINAINMSQRMCSRSEGCSRFHQSQPSWASWAPFRQNKWNKRPFFCYVFFFFFNWSERPYLASSSIWKGLLSAAPGPGKEAELNHYRWKQWVHLQVSKALHSCYITGTIRTLYGIERERLREFNVPINAVVPRGTAGWDGQRKDGQSSYGSNWGRVIMIMMSVYKYICFLYQSFGGGVTW